MPQSAEHQRSKHTHTIMFIKGNYFFTSPENGNTGTTSEHGYIHSNNLLLFQIWQYCQFYTGYVNSIAWLDFSELGIFPNLAFSRSSYVRCADISQTLWPVGRHVNSTIIKLRFYSGFLTHSLSVYSNGRRQQNTRHSFSCTAAKRMHTEELYFVWKRISVTP